MLNYFYMVLWNWHRSYYISLLYGVYFNILVLEILSLCFSYFVDMSVWELWDKHKHNGIPTAWLMCIMFIKFAGRVHGTWWETSSYRYTSPWCSCWKGFASGWPLQFLNIWLIYVVKFLLVQYSFQCRAFAKALHYKEMEFEGACSKKMYANPVAVVEALIHINNQLHQHEV